MFKKFYQWLIPENVYRLPIRFIVSKDHDKAWEWIKKNVSDHCTQWTSAQSGRTMSFEGVSEIVVWIRTPDNLAVLAHETVHAVFMILDARGVPTREENSEAFAYLYEYFFGEMLHLLGHDKFTYRKK